jgi:hypothetical protein
MLAEDRLMWFSLSSAPGANASSDSRADLGAAYELALLVERDVPGPS